MGIQVTDWSMAGVRQSGSRVVVLLFWWASPCPAEKNLRLPGAHAVHSVKPLRCGWDGFHVTFPSSHTSTQPHSNHLTCTWIITVQHFHTSVQPHRNYLRHELNHISIIARLISITFRVCSSLDWWISWLFFKPALQVNFEWLGAF